MNKQFRVKLIVAISFIFIINNMVIAQEIFNSVLERDGKFETFEVDGVKYDWALTYGYRTGSTIQNRINNEYIIKKSRGYKDIYIMGNFILTYPNYKYMHPKFHILNLEGKFLIELKGHIQIDAKYTTSAISIYDEKQRWGLLSKDGTMALPFIYNFVKLISIQNKTWEVTTNDGLYIYDENTRKLSPKDGKEIVKVKLPEIKGYEFIVNYDFKDDSKIDIKIDDCLVKEIGNDVWFVVDVKKAKTGIYNGASKEWIIKPDYGINMFADKDGPKCPNFGYNNVANPNRAYFRESLVDAFEATGNLKDRGFYVINNNEKNEWWNLVGKSSIFNENKLQAEIPFFVSTILTNKIWNINKSAKILVLQDFKGSKLFNQKTRYFENFRIYRDYIDLENLRDYNSRNNVGLANSNGKILVAPEYRGMDVVNIGGKTIIYLADKINTNENKILELVNDEELVPYNDFEDLKVFYASRVFSAKKMGKWGVLDFNGNEILPFNFENPINVYGIYGNFLQSSVGLQYQLTSKSGEILPYKYTFIESLKDGNIKAFVYKYDKQMDDEKVIVRDIFYDHKTKKTTFSKNLAFDRLKDIGAYKKMGLNAIDEDGNKTYANGYKEEKTNNNQTVGNMSRDWMEQTKSYLYNFENFKKACERFKGSTSNSNKKEVQYWLDNLNANNRVIRNILNHSNDKSLTIEEQNQYKAIAQQQQKNINNFQEQLNNGVYTVLDALLYQLEKGSK